MDWNELAVRTGNVLLVVLANVTWCAFWLWAVNWKKAWQVLAQGGWVPLVLLIIVGTIAWSRIAPDGSNLDFLTIPSFWWQLAVVLAWTGMALFCGWLQGYFRITPIEVEVEPPAVAHGHGQ